MGSGANFASGSNVTVGGNINITLAAANVGGEPVKKQPVKKVPKPGRNDPCPCGKMKADGSRRLKYKECCGRNE